MAWICVDENGQEMIFDSKPYRTSNRIDGEYWKSDMAAYYMDLPKGTIFKLVGKELTWEDEPIELTDIKLNRPKKINWGILTLSIIWSLFLVVIMSVFIKYMLCRVIIAIVISVVFYFGYSDVE